MPDVLKAGYAIQNTFESSPIKHGAHELGDLNKSLLLGDPILPDRRIDSSPIFPESNGIARKLAKLALSRFGNFFLISNRCRECRSYDTTADPGVVPDTYIVRQTLRIYELLHKPAPLTAKQALENDNSGAVFVPIRRGLEPDRNLAGPCFALLFYCHPRLEWFWKSVGKLHVLEA